MKKKEKSGKYRENRRKVQKTGKFKKIQEQCRQCNAVKQQKTQGI